MNGVLTRIRKTLSPIISPSKLHHKDPVKFLEEGKTDPDCVSKMWLEGTTLEAVIPPLVETSALIRSSKGLWNFEMNLTTRLGFGAGDSKDIQDKIQSSSGNESRGDAYGAGGSCQ